MLKQKNSKKQGDVGLGVAIGWFTVKGWTVCVPLTDSQDYDLLVDDGEKINRIFVRTTRVKSRNKSGGYCLELRVKGGNLSGKGKVKYFSPELVDYVFALTDSGDKYFIPSSSITAKSGIVLGKEYQEYLVF